MFLAESPWLPLFSVKVDYDCRQEADEILEKQDRFNFKQEACEKKKSPVADILFVYYKLYEQSLEKTYSRLSEVRTRRCWVPETSLLVSFQRVCGSVRSRTKAGYARLK